MKAIYSDTDGDNNKAVFLSNKVFSEFSGHLTYYPLPCLITDPSTTL